jgi:hypothetical protein
VATITSIYPKQGPLVGLTVFTVTGTNFGIETGNDITITVGTKDCTATQYISDTEMRCSATQADTQGAKDVTVTTKFTGTVTLAGAFTFNDAPTFSSVLVLGGVTPTYIAQGPLAGGTPITIVGGNFGNSGVDNAITITVGCVCFFGLAVACVE